MAVNHDYEPIHGSILHKGSLHTLEGAIFELLSKEVRLNILKLLYDTIDTNRVMIIPNKADHSKKSSEKFCNYCLHDDVSCHFRMQDHVKQE